MDQPPELDSLNVPISNPTKALYPSGYTKAQIIDYYIQVAPFILPHLRDRPPTMKRYPDGVRGEFFYEKNAPSFTPAWVQTSPAFVRAADRYGMVCRECVTK
jgi:bifunctional non-homologous end joining protein LigD